MSKFNTWAEETAVRLQGSIPVKRLFIPLNNNNNTYIALIRMRSKRFTSIVLQYDLEI